VTLIYLFVKMPSKPPKSQNEEISATQFKFAKQLAAIDKPSRDKAVRVLRNWLSKKADLTHFDYMKIWKGLYYCYWLSDKPFIQEELAVTLSQLILYIKPTPFVFIKAFFDTIAREWPSIDGLRLNKFYSLLRKFIFESLQYLQSHKWEPKIMDEWNLTLTEGPLVKNCEQRGLTFHIIFIFLDEVYSTCGKEVPA